MRYNILLVVLILLIPGRDAVAQEGLYVRFSVGTGYYAEHSVLDDSGFTTPAKNHALGWGLNERFGLQISDFGALIKQKVGDYDYMNLDALGLGLSYYIRPDTYLCLSGGYGKVTLAHDWTQIMNDGRQEGLALSLTLNREWLLSKRWSIGLGAQGFYFKTRNIQYEFTHLGLTGAISHYFTPVG